MTYNELTGAWNGRSIGDLTVEELLRRSAESKHGVSRAMITDSDGSRRKETLREKLLRETSAIEETILMLSGKLSDRHAQLRKLSMFPIEDLFSEDAPQPVISFEKHFPHDPDRIYSYGAMRADGLWYVTGSRSPNGVTWAELIDWMGLGVDEVYHENHPDGRIKIIG